MRNITVVSTKNSTRPVTIQSAATTWGELTPKLNEEGLLPERYRAIDKDTKNDFGSDEAVLPEGDFTVWISPKEVKSAAQVRGVTNQFRTPEQAFEEAVNYLRRINQVLEDVRPYIGTDSAEDEVEKAQKWFDQERKKGNL